MMLSNLLAWSLLISGGTTAGQAGLAASHPPAMATNPLIWADVPDPSVIRVGGAYYMASTTMHMTPGLPIMKSEDLVNWRLVSYASEKLGDNEALNLQNGRNAYGRGSWAPSLRHHKGVFYASTFSATTGRTHIYSTDDPEKGAWKEKSFSPSFHDHSLFFEEDGRAFLVYGAGEIRLVELKSDLSGVKEGGLSKVIIPNATAAGGGQPGLPAEGSQLFKINGRYYLCNITWPRNGMRTALVHRADRLEGPYEGRIMLQDKGVAQGGLIDTPDGRWFALLFRDTGAVGRIPWLVPVSWDDGWPVAGVQGKAPETLDLPGGNLGVMGIVGSDEFDRRPGDSLLPLPWQWNHNPDPSSWSLTSRPGHLRITASRTDATVVQARNTLTQRSFGPTSAAWTLVDGSSLRDGDAAGLVALMGRYGWIALRKEGETFSVSVTVRGESVEEETARAPVDQKQVYLGLECDFQNLKDTARFAYSLDGVEWIPVGPPFRLHYDLSHFMGCRFGLFCFSQKTPGGHADFDFFRIGERLTQPMAKT